MKSSLITCFVLSASLVKAGTHNDTEGQYFYGLIGVILIIVLLAPWVVKQVKFLIVNKGLPFYRKMLRALESYFDSLLNQHLASIS